MNAAPKRVAILGGGIAGLAVAYELQRQRTEHPATEFVLFEASGRLGGIVETFHLDGFVIECGPDSWVTEKPWAREIAADLGLDSEIIASNDASRRTLILQDGTLIPMPEGMRMMVPTNLDAIASSPLFTTEARQGYACEPARAEELKAATPEEDESVATFVRRHFGEEAARKIAGPLLSGVFGGSIERLSVRSVMPAFVKMEREYGSLIAALQSRPPAQSRASIFTTLASGLSTLVNAMAATLPPTSIRFHQPVNAVTRQGAQWLVSAPTGAEIFDALVLATPAHVTRQLLTTLDWRFDEALAIDASSAIVVAFAYTPKDGVSLNIPRGFGFLVPQYAAADSAASTDPSLLACTFVDQKFPYRVPQGGVLLRAFYGGDSAPPLLSESDQSLVARAQQQLMGILGPMPRPSFTVVRRWPRSLPQYEVGHEARIAALEERVSRYAGLHLTGNTYHGVGLPDLIRDGRALARRMIAEAV